jgi:short-subunit dehydrogenase
MSSMNNRLVLITGGSSGIGKATAASFLAQGAKVILQARNLDKLHAAKEELGNTNVSIYSTNLTNESSVLQSAEEIIAKEGLPDIVVNSAGAGEWLSFKESNLGHYEETMSSPYLATALTCKAFYDQMQARGTGHFIIINSAACFFAFPGATGYTPARWAMLGFSKSLQADLHKTKFKVSMIAFGKVDSPYFANNPVSESRIPKIVDWLIPTLSVEQAAKEVVQTAQSPKNIVIKPFMMRLCVNLNRFFPGVFQWFMLKTGNNTSR